MSLGVCKIMSGTYILKRAKFDRSLQSYKVTSFLVPLIVCTTHIHTYLNVLIEIDVCV
jgi:hypothetical protein